MSSDMLIQEVDEELRRDRMRKLWRQTGPWIIAAAVAVVLGVAAYEGWTWWQKTQSSASSDQFYAATKIADGTDFAAAKKALDDIIAKGSGGYPMLAQFREAALLAQQGKTNEAVAAYDALSSSINNTHLRELALVLAGNLLVDKGDVAAVEQRVGGIMTPASPLRNAAREEMGLVQYKAGKLDDAMKSFEAIVEDPLSTRDEQSRVQIYMLQLQAEGAKPISPPADATTPSAPPADISSVAPPAETSSASAAPSASVAPSASASAPTGASAEPSVGASAAPAAAPSAPAATSAATDAGTDLAITPPVIDTSALQMAMPQTSAAPADATSSVPAVSAEAVSSSAPAVSSSVPASPASSSAP
ncbi:MAG TPA: tetratricopeptide repeat protein [Devosia sp.]|nr:tetratricopeptide repeat protein [Devosia sp.]